MAPSQDRSCLEKVIGARHMSRHFSTDGVDPAKVHRILDLARRSPSAGNTQATEFLVLDQVQDVKRYWATTMSQARQEAFAWPTLLAAPVLVLVLTRPGAYLRRYHEPDKAKTGRWQSEDRWPVPYWWVDSGAVVQNVLLLATESQLGACLFGPFDHESNLRETFSVPLDRRIVATIALGHPLPGRPSRSANRQRPELSSILHYGSWTRPDHSELSSVVRSPMT